MTRYMSMPAEYFQDTIRAQLRSLMDEDLLQDTSIILRANSVKLSSFLLSLVSPVLRNMVCGNFKESASRRINLDDVEDGHFMKLVRLACGKDDVATESFAELLDIGALADRLQMDAIREHAENILLKRVKKGTCVELFQACEANGLERLRTGCYKILQDKFQSVSYEEGFATLSDETMGNLLEEDELGAEGEEAVFEALVRWMKRSGEGIRGERLLTKIRYGVINDEYLANFILSTLPRREMLKNLVGEALAMKRGGQGEGQWDGVGRLCDKWIVSRSMNRIVGSDILKSPNSIAIDLEGHLVVSDQELHQVIVFDHDGSVVRRIGSQGTAAGQFNEPNGVAVDREGRIVVSDCGNHRIQVLNADGSVDRCFGSEGSVVGQLNRPHGVAIDGNGHIVVVDSWNSRIQVFDVDGSVVRHFGSKGAAVGQVFYPRGVAVDRMGRAVVADCSNHRVQVFNGDGSVALCFGSSGVRPGQFNHPDGVAMDREGRFIVTDRDNHRIQVFNSDGIVARVIDAAESGAGRLKYPCGVAVSGTGRIVVVEGEYNKREAVRIL